LLSTARTLAGKGAPQLTQTVPNIEFASALSARRELVYSYLDIWRGIPNFRPEHMQEAILSYVRQRGKALRPTLLLLACGAVGGEEDRAVPAAAAVEVFQIWTLVHDDVIDRDLTRRGNPTVHAAFSELARTEMNLPPGEAAHYGTSVAILAGDLQQSWSYALLCDLITRGVPPVVVTDLISRMATSLTPRLMEGEMLDVQYSLRTRDIRINGDSQAMDQIPTGEAVLDMLGKKTGTLLEYAAWAGARIGSVTGSADPILADKLESFARLCGRAFQLHDDILGLTADERVLGKPVGSDLREGKLTYIVSLALETASSAQQERLSIALGNQSATASQIESAVAVLRETGAMQQTATLAQTYIDEALQQLESLPASEHRDLLRAWATFLLSRHH
jgi:geranylgeranyl diphosphate synthase type I